MEISGNEIESVGVRRFIISQP